MLAICLAIMAGCRTPQPNLKPDPTAEKLVSPPTRLDVAGLRKEAFDKPSDPMQGMDTKNGVMPTRGSSMGGMGGAGMPGR
jgi:hypothetical protein